VDRPGRVRRAFEDKAVEEFASGNVDKIVRGRPEGGSLTAALKRDTIRPKEMARGTICNARFDILTNFVAQTNALVPGH
jgi:hypothetical protein